MVPLWVESGGFRLFPATSTPREFLRQGNANRKTAPRLIFPNQDLHRSIPTPILPPTIAFPIQNSRNWLSGLEQLRYGWACKHQSGPVGDSSPPVPRDKGQRREQREELMILTDWKRCRYIKQAGKKESSGDVPNSDQMQIADHADNRPAPAKT